LCDKGGKLAISVAGDVCGTSHRRGTHYDQDLNSIPARATHTIFCHASVFIDYGKGDAGIYAKTIFHESNGLVLFILSFMHGGYNINIRYR